MKVIVSSKVLAVALSKIDLEKEHIQRAVLAVGSLSLISQNHVAKIPAVVDSFAGIVIQDTRRWDWVKRLVCNVEDQPIILDIQRDVINVIFQY